MSNILGFQKPRDLNLARPQMYALATLSSIIDMLRDAKQDIQFKSLALMFTSEERSKLRDAIQEIDEGVIS